MSAHRNIASEYPPTYQSFDLPQTTLSPSLHAFDFSDLELGKVKSSSCVFCRNPTAETSRIDCLILSDQYSIYLYDQMKAYQNEDRQGAYAEMRRAQLRKPNDQG
ncbi:cytochrome c [Vibrio splendidus]|uniref:c-type cytochrome n=1 Tax=Vibrio splendidus TaxID=29497 RepID=UPI001F53CFD3|nr:cytochrome c [Vibrio splendidus]